MMPCKTKQDACYRVSTARIGSLVEPTEEYLLRLRQDLHDWLRRVDEALIASKVLECGCIADTSCEDCVHIRSGCKTGSGVFCNSGVSCGCNCHDKEEQDCQQAIAEYRNHNC